MAKSDGRSSVIGMARLGRQLISGDVSALWTALAARYEADPGDADALFDLSMLLRLSGKVEQADSLQDLALSLQNTFSCRHGQGLAVVVFVTGADVLANAPIDFLCEGSELTLHFLHVDAPSNADIPDHDVAFVAIGQSATNNTVLDRLGRVLSEWPKPVMNIQCDRIRAMTREGTSALFADTPAVLAPKNVIATRATVEALASGDCGLENIASGFDYPILIRPVETHGGKGLAKIDARGEWSRYLTDHGDEEFVLGPFIDYSFADGLYRKLRITFIDGVPFPAHMAISDHWLVHYISAGMLTNAAKRAEEAAWMDSFDVDFAVRHAEALRTVAERIGVDYFSIDCAETSDGRFVLFEADVAAIVHALDPEEIFPYKRPTMDKLFAAFRAALARRAGRDHSLKASAAA